MFGSRYLRSTFRAFCFYLSSGISRGWMALIILAGCATAPVAPNDGKTLSPYELIRPELSQKVPEWRIQKVNAQWLKARATAKQSQRKSAPVPEKLLAAIEQILTDYGRELGIDFSNRFIDLRDFWVALESQEFAGQYNSYLRVVELKPYATKDPMVLQHELIHALEGHKLTKADRTQIVYDSGFNRFCQISGTCFFKIFNEAMTEMINFHLITNHWKRVPALKNYRNNISLAYAEPVVFLDEVIHQIAITRKQTYKEVFLTLQRSFFLGDDVWMNYVIEALGYDFAHKLAYERDYKKIDILAFVEKAADFPGRENLLARMQQYKSKSKTVGFYLHMDRRRRFKLLSAAQ